MSVKTKVIVWLLLLGVAFGTGFMLAYSEVVDLRAELRSTEDSLQDAQGDMEALRAEIELAELRDLAGLIYLETAKKNYEVAAGYSTQLFNAIGSKSADSSDLGTSLEQLLERRDMVTAVLAKGDPVALGEVQALVTRVHEITRPTQ